MSDHLRGQTFQNMCQIDQCEGTESFVAIRRVLRELFAKKLWGEGPFNTPLQVRGLTLVGLIVFQHTVQIVALGAIIRTAYRAG